MGRLNLSSTRANSPVPAYSGITHHMTPWYDSTALVLSRHPHLFQSHLPDGATKQQPHFRNFQRFFVRCSNFQDHPKFELRIAKDSSYLNFGTRSLHFKKIVFSKVESIYNFWPTAGPTNGRAYATVFRPSVRPSVCL